MKALNLCCNRQKFDVSQDQTNSRDKLFQVLYCTFANLSIISSGMALGYPAITSQLLLKDSQLPLSESQVSWFASVTAITCPLGGLLSGYLSDLIGRKRTLILIDIIAIISWIIIGFSSRENVNVLFIQLMISRTIIGVIIGMSTTPAVMYTTEVCDPNIRGRLTMLSSPFFTAFGMLLIYLLGYLIPNDYRMVSHFAAGITLITLFVCFFIPESPVYLINIDQTEQARKSLSILKRLRRNHPDIDEEIQIMISNRNNSRQNSTTGMSWQEFKKPQFYKPFIIMIIFFTIQQFSGIFTIFIYAAQFSIEAGVSIDEFLCTVIIGLIRCSTVIIVSFASDIYGRKPIATISTSGMCLSMLGLVICSIFSLELKQSTIFWLPTVFLFFFIFSGTFGVLTLPFAMIAEVYPQNTRGLAVGLTIFYAYMMSFINVKTFTAIFSVFGRMIVFSFYGVISLVGIAFAVIILPETKGKTLHEIECYFSK